MGSGPVEKVHSSLLKKIFSTILKLTPLQIRNSRSAQTVEFAAVLFVKNGTRKNLQFALGVPFLGFFNTPEVPISSSVPISSLFLLTSKKCALAVGLQWFVRMLIACRRMGYMPAYR